jgi:hypothetical protein
MDTARRIASLTLLLSLLAAASPGTTAAVPIAGVADRMALATHVGPTVRGVVAVRTDDGGAGRLSAVLLGLSGGRKHQIVFASGPCGGAFDPAGVLASATIGTGGRRAAFRADLPMDVSALSFDTWDNGSSWILRGARGTKALGCAPVEAFEGVAPGTSGTEVALAVLRGAGPRGIVVFGRDGDDQIAVVAALMGLPASAPFGIVGNVQGCDGAHEPSSDVGRFGGTATGGGTAFLKRRGDTLGGFAIEDIASTRLGPRAAPFSPTACVDVEFDGLTDTP